MASTIKIFTHFHAVVALLFGGSGAFAFEGVDLPESPNAPGQPKIAATYAEATRWVSKSRDYRFLGGRFVLQSTSYTFRSWYASEMRYEILNINSKNEIDYSIYYNKCNGAQAVFYRRQALTASGEFSIYSHDFGSPYDSSEKSDEFWYQHTDCVTNQTGLDYWNRRYSGRRPEFQEKRQLRYVDVLGGYYFTDGKRSKYGRMEFTSSNYNTTVSIDYNKDGTLDRLLVNESGNDYSLSNDDLTFVSTKSSPFISNYIRLSAPAEILRAIDTVSIKKKLISSNWAFQDSLDERAAFLSELNSLNRAAVGGQVRAMKQLAWLYLSGDRNNGFAIDVDTALSWYERAAQSNDVEAQNLLGVYYSQGFLRNQSEDRVSGSTGKNLSLARFWLEKAATSGYLQAQKNLVTMAENAEYDRTQQAQQVAQQQARQDQLRQALGFMIQQQQLQLQQEQARREAAERRRAQEAQLQAQREQTAAYERQQAANRQAADQRAFEDRRASAIQAQQQQIGQTSGPPQSYSQPQPGNQPPGSSNGNSQAQADAERRRQEQLAQDRLRQQQLQAAKANPKFHHRMEDTRTGYAVVITNLNQFDILCQATIDGYRWVGTRQEVYRSTDPIYVSAGSEGRYEWSMQRVGARYTVSSCQGR
jgi:hypothetical protein